MKTTKKTSKKKYEVEVGTTITFNADPTTTEQATSFFKRLFKRVGHTIKIETKLYLFDKFNGTDYRTVHHVLVKEAKCRRFEASIGIQRTA